MTIIAERGLFVRLLVQSGKFETASAEALADALDSASKDPATRLDLLDVKTEIALLKSELTQLRAEVRSGDASLAQQMQAQTDKLLVRLGGLMIAVVGLAFAALRLT